MDGSCLDDSEIEEERAGGGPGPAGRGPERAQPVEGRSRRTGHGSGPTTSIQNADGAFTYRMTAETLRVRHCMCDLHMHMDRYDRSEVVLTLLRSIRLLSYAIESQIRKANKRISNVSCRIQL
jgi:hypothetical protein